MRRPVWYDARLTRAARLALVLVLMPLQAAAQGRDGATPLETRSTFASIMDAAQQGNWQAAPLGQVMQRVGEALLGKPYADGLLDKGEDEVLVSGLDAFDCVLLVEAVMALARVIKEESFDYGAYERFLQAQRYRGGVLDGYCSRLHYFSEWIADNERRGVVRNLTPSLGGIPLEKTLSFMGTHRESYPRLVASDSLYQGILDMERQLENLALYYIPQDRIRDVYPHLQAGDIIATATHIKGLDVTHTGLAYDGGQGRIGFLHASTKGGVKVSPDLQAYIQNNKVQIGIVVVRPIAAP